MNPLGIRSAALNAFLASVLACATAAGAESRSGEPRPKTLSIEAALNDVRIGIYDRPELSPDGRFLAYSTTSGPPAQSITSRFGKEVPYLPNGMLASLYAARLYVTDVASGATHEVNPGAWSNWNPSFAPDSRQLAFYSDAGGLPQLWVADAITGRTRRVSDARIFVKMWSGRDRAVWTGDASGVFVLVAHDVVAPGESGAHDAERARVVVKGSGAESVDVAAQPDADTVSLFGFAVRRAAIELLNVASGSSHAIVVPPPGPQPHAFMVSPSGDWVAYVSAVSEMDRSFPLAVVSVRGGDAYSLGSVPALVYDGPGPSSEMYAAAVHWTPAQDRLVVVRDGAYHLVSFSDSAPGPPLRLASDLGPVIVPPGTDSHRFDQPTFAADGSFVVARLPARDAIAFAVIPLDGSVPRRMEVPGSESFRGFVTARHDVLWQPEPASMLFNSLDVSGRRVVTKVGLHSGRVTRLMQSNASLDFVTSVSPRRIVAAYSDATTAPDLFEFGPTLGQRRRLTHVNASLEQVPSSSTVTFTTRAPSYDGSMRTLKTSVIFPVGYRRGDRPPPALVRVYPANEMSKYANVFGAGRLSGGELAQLWTTRGYAVVLPDLLPLTPAHEGNGNLIRELSDYLLAQLYHAAALGYVDIDRLVLTGHSAGAYAVSALITETSLFRAAVAYSPAPLDLLSTSEQWWPRTVAALGESSNPWTAFKQYLTNSPYHQADKIRTPILLLHGGADNLSQIASEQMYGGLAQLGNTAQLALYPGESHYIGWWSRASALDATRRVVDFVTRHVPEQAARAER